MSENEETVEPVVAETVKEEREDAPEAAVEPLEVSEDPKPKKRAEKAVERPDWVRAEAGDSYLSLARRWLPDQAPGIAAPFLARINGKKPIRENVKIYLKEQK